MLLNSLFDRFAQSTPVCVAARATLEAALAPEALDQLFHNTAELQYERELLFSSCVDIMSLVVTRTHRTLHAAYQADPKAIGVSLKAMYDKISNIETVTTSALVRHTSTRLAPIICEMKGQSPPPLINFRTKILDGNHLGKTERRLKPLRDVAAGPLPGHTLAVYDPALGLVLDIVCCEDGHAQERSLLNDILPMVENNDVWIADRNFCTTKFLFGIAAQLGKFVIRQHASTLTWEKEGKVHSRGRCERGAVREQTLTLTNPDGSTLRVRRISIKLDEPTQDGDTEIHLLTTLTQSEASAKVVADLYVKRWKIEQVFQTLTTVLKCEVTALGFPKAALFAFGVAVAAFNIYATVKASLRAVHGIEKVENEVSDYFLGDEISGTYRGMMVAIPAEHWVSFQTADAETLAKVLLELAAKAKLSRYPKSRRGPKKPKPRRWRYAAKKHVATSRILAEQKGK